jgi:uncharacterized membrane protein
MTISRPTAHAVVRTRPASCLGRDAGRAEPDANTLDRIRQIIAVNLQLGLLVVVIGRSGRYWG